MRRRQMFAAQSVVQTEPVVVESVKEVVEKKQSYKAGNCPNCGKYIAKGMYFHIKGCHG